MKMFKILKQELLFIPIMLLIVELFRKAIVAFYPETALFDRGSELETFLFRVWQITWITSASWILLRIIFPAAHRALVRFYHSFEDFKEEYQQEFGIKTFLTFFFALVLLLSGRASNSEPIIRKQLFDTLNSQLHVRELTGNNDGVEVEKYLRFVGRQKGDAWCAAFVSYNFHAIGIKKPLNPISAWAPSFANEKYVISSQKLIKTHKAKKAQVGDVFTLFYPKLNRVGHVGFIVGESGAYYITSEGNTGLSGSREGSGHHRLKRSKQKVHTISNYITPYLKSNEKDLSFIILYHPDVFLSAEINADKHFNHRADTGQFLCMQRLDLVCERYFESTARQFNDTSNCNSGRQWPDKSTRDSNSVGTLKICRFDFKRKAESKVFMRGAGTYCSQAEPANTRTTNFKRAVAPRQTHRGSKGSSRNSEMG